MTEQPLTGHECPGDPCIIVIFGASGDLTARKLIPALFYLSRERMLPAGFSVIGCARTPKTDEEFRAEMSAGVRKFLHLTADDAEWNVSHPRYHIQGILIRPTPSNIWPRKLPMLRNLNLPGNVLFYLAVAALSSRRLSTSSTVWVLPAKPAKRGAGDYRGHLVGISPAPGI
jgi:glucose-6-phosphate 1-dehydrogenase